MSPSRVLGLEPTPRPRPQVRVEMGRAVPAWLLRAVTGTAVVGLGGAATGQWVVAALVGLVVGLVPHLGVVAGLAALAGVALLGDEPDPLRCAALVLALHAAQTGVRLSAPVGPTGLVEVRLVRRVLAGAAVMQLIAQGAVALAFVALAEVPVVPWAGAVALVAVGVGSWSGLRWLRERTA